MKNKRSNYLNFAFYKNYLLDLIFPKFCVGCGTEGDWVCKNCGKNIVSVKTQVCPKCLRISKVGRYCKGCKKGNSLSGIIVAAYYEEGPIKEAIHNLKYNHVLELGGLLGGLMAEALKENGLIDKNILITATPMHFWRRAQRGYNQAEILAEEVFKALSLDSPGSPLAFSRPSQPRLELRSGHRHFARGIPRAPLVNIEENFKIIKKIRKTKSQVKFSGKKRRENLKKAFKIIDKSAVKGKTIIIVDDVTTTGTTLEECAKVLKAAGAKKVWGLVAARG